MDNNKTIFERIIAREISAEILFENESMIIIKDIAPQAPIHVLIIPKQKIERISKITKQEADIVSNLMLAAVEFAEKNNITNYRLVINNGLLAGETVPHLHIHLLSGREMKWPPG